MPSQLEREPGEAIVDPWVRERFTLVAVRRNAVVGAAHLLRYGDDEPVGPAFRDVGEIRWLLFWPDQELRGGMENADTADALAADALEELRRRGATPLTHQPTRTDPAGSRGSPGICEGAPGLRDARGLRRALRRPTNPRAATTSWAAPTSDCPGGRP